MATHRHGRHLGSRHLSSVPLPPSPPSGDEMRDLQAFVGGFVELMRLDAEPLPNENFDWSSVEPRDARFVGLVLALVDECCAEMLDDEYRTITLRNPARV